MKISCWPAVVAAGSFIPVAWSATKYTTEVPETVAPVARGEAMGAPTVKLAPADAPVGPVAPAAPVGPAGPATIDAAPVGPVAPAVPTPVGPVTPLAPATPVGPAA